jgi:Protein of unknown function (DUF2771)
VPRRSKLGRLLPVLAAALAVAGCGGSAPPDVTFAAGAANIVAKPTQYCDIDLTNCSSDASAPVELTVPPGTPLQITVPDAIASTPWQVVFSYRDGAGAQTDGRSPVFPVNAQQTYSLQLPGPTDRLLGAQVQQYGPPPQFNEGTGELEFPIRASWVLTAKAA